ncbi:hypothetical protein BO224_02700 [Erysipelotrichaceae bacterium NYU-BL-E8]|uniref:Uncharacterized protein n=1 Tax=Ileibacterium valens TaxID=1862668 RepID=A0A1U7NDH2_9FIRM|nr:hypothetical protein BO222_11055 [Ileibacterium valens]OLU38027.1 hypothetical protein BM735_09835 [Erysipelotrichaceae bacterium NYU-BL-F16]OLU41975.1 hypothetical protein BO224_02700 [Erysipelotrichaceae bacterium NYU-BL-E8]
MLFHSDHQALLNYFHSFLALFRFLTTVSSFSFILSFVLFVSFKSFNIFSSVSLIFFKDKFLTLHLQIRTKIEQILFFYGPRKERTYFYTHFSK